jgi:hypothetical protein
MSEVSLLIYGGYQKMFGERCELIALFFLEKNISLYIFSKPQISLPQLE